MEKTGWDAVPNHILGKSGESYADFMLLAAGYEVFRPALDDGHGIDRVIRDRSGQKLDVQIKSARDHKSVFLRKGKFPLRDDMALLLIHFRAGKSVPDIYRIPATAWKDLRGVFRERIVEGEWCWWLDLSAGAEDLKTYLMTT